jgi:hypothetical protein
VTTSTTAPPTLKGILATAIAASVAVDITKPTQPLKQHVKTIIINDLCIKPDKLD